MIMVLDTSAIVAILQDEPEADRLVSALIDAPVRRISSATLVETGIVIYARFGDAGEREVDLFIHRLRVDVLPVTADHANLARSAYRRFGKGQHPAGLNYGDCFSYALAMALQEPLLFKGGDFSQTDVLVASY
jgi:ribonuclease VapC